jgi:hypothetical protein
MGLTDQTNIRMSCRSVEHIGQKANLKYAIQTKFGKHDWPFRLQIKSNLTRHPNWFLSVASLECNNLMVWSDRPWEKVERKKLQVEKV